MASEITGVNKENFSIALAFFVQGVCLCVPFDTWLNLLSRRANTSSNGRKSSRQHPENFKFTGTKQSLLVQALPMDNQLVVNLLAGKDLKPAVSSIDMDKVTTSSTGDALSLAIIPLQISSSAQLLFSMMQP